VARTSGNIRWPPSPLAPGLLAASDLDSISRPPHHCGSVVVPHTRQSLLSKMQSAESSGDNLRLSSCSAPPPEPLVVNQPTCTQVEGADTVMQSSGDVPKTLTRKPDMFVSTRT